MKILVTGAKGFVGRNLVEELKHRECGDVFECDIDTSKEEFDRFTKECDIVYHLAGVNRPKNEDEFMKGNFGFTSELLENLKKHNNKATIVMTSSIQAELDNPYGKSKKAGEDLILGYGKDNDVKTVIYRMPNLFGKWCRPNYNSVIATFCNNIANNLEIAVNDPEIVLNLAYIDDVVEELISVIENKEHYNGIFAYVPITYKVKLGDIAEKLYSFKKIRNNLYIPDVRDGFTKKLYSTYISYFPKQECIYDLKMNVDNRGSFTEMFKSEERGQVSVNISKPGIVKGNHWHHTKNEKFVVVSGEGIIRLRKVGTEEVFEYRVSGNKIQVVDIPCGYTHNIENVGKQDMVTIMWCNEVFNPEKPDTYHLEV